MLVSATAVAATLIPASPADAANADSTGVKVTCSANYVCGWAGTYFNGLGNSTHPPDATQCKRLALGYLSVINQAFVTVRLWTGANCTGTNIQVRPGESITDLGQPRRWMGSL